MQIFLFSMAGLKKDVEMYSKIDQLASASDFRVINLIQNANFKSL